MPSPKFSVLCPTYNHESYIAQCIESVKQQTFQDWELLILDDGSSDKTGEVVKLFLKDKRIHYFHQENKGAGKVPENYNILLNKAKGNFITILEGDDFASPHLLEEHLKAFDKKPNSILSFNIVNVMEPGYNWTAPKLPKNENEKLIFENIPVGNALNELFFRCFIPAQGVTIRRDILIEAGGFEKVEGLPTVDYPTWLKLAQKGSFIFVPKVLANWRRHQTQSTKQRIVILTKLMLPEFLNTYDNLPDNLKSALKVSRSQIKNHWDVQLTKILIRGGNYQLQSGQWKQARQYYIESFKKWTSVIFLWRTKATIGLLFSFFHIPWFHWKPKIK